MKTFLKYFVELTGHPVSSSILKTITTSRISKPLIKPFSNVYGIRTDEMEHDITHYRSLHEFFTRRLKDGVRTIEQSPTILTSPVDGVLSEMGEISANQTFYIKDRLYNIREVLGDDKKAAAYENGYFFILYLSPSHYHRIHYPINGKLISRYALGEKSFPVNNIGMRWGNSPFSTNYRIISEIMTSFGKVALVKVGALNINSIRLVNSSSDCKKGEEVGYFSFGSTVILFVEKNGHFKPLIRNNTEVQLGQPLGEWVE